MTERLDRALVAAGLVRSRAHAQRLVTGGVVRVDGDVVLKVSTPVAEGASLRVDAEDGWVSRAAHKLLAALDAFDVRVDGRVCLDLGASTGGFTQVLLARGADTVVALDVGHGQLVTDLRFHPRVVVVEGENARDLDRARLDGLTGARPVGVVTADLSFIALGLVLPAIARSAPDADVVLLVKPQFEVGRGRTREGVVTDPALRADAVMQVLWTAHDLGYRVRGVIASPLPGSAGNREALVHLHPTLGTDPSEWSGVVDAEVGRGS